MGVHALAVVVGVPAAAMGVLVVLLFGLLLVGAVNRRYSMFLIWRVLSPKADRGLRICKRRLLQAAPPAPAAHDTHGDELEDQRPAAHVTGTIVELGPGLGTNLKYYANNPGVARVVLVEPNPYMHAGLRRAAAAAGLVADRYEVVAGSAESMPFVPTGSADAVVCTLVLCSVSNPARCMTEVQRVLRPGGRFVFCEHVVADPDTEPWTRRLQRLAMVTGLWSALGDGCSVERDTGALIRGQRGWASVHVRRQYMSGPIVAAPHVWGWAERAAAGR
jgi:SAM-dependent methyltransferase